MKKINKDNTVFKSNDFQKDKNKFFVLVQNLMGTNTELYSDEKNYVICRVSFNLPIWIWTKDNFDISLLNEIELAMDKFLIKDGKHKFVCKKDLYDLLIKDDYKYINDDYFEMGTLSCTKTIKPKQVDGYMDLPNEDDKSLLIQYWFDDCNETQDGELVSIKQAEDDINAFYESKSFYVWRNENDKVVCMAHALLFNKQAKISHVYTPIEERNKGYASNLIYSLTNKSLEQGYSPLLYTEYNYIPSNKAYINVGYVDTGILISFSCSKR